MLISAKVNQWTLLIGSLPVAYLFGGGSTSLVLDARQVEEVLLTATQTLMGVAILLALRFPRWAAYTLFGLFAVQFFIPGMYGRLVISAVYAVIAVALLVVHRHQIIQTLRALIRPVRPEVAAEPMPERAPVGVH
jgi:cation:H+ antiporter